VVILADSRFNRQDKRSKLPPWIINFMKESSLNLSTEVAVEQIKHFLRQMGQEIDQTALRTILLDVEQVNRLQAASQGRLRELGAEIRVEGDENQVSASALVGEPMEVDDDQVGEESVILMKRRRMDD
jgi:UDP-N-acetylglucosamine enolpyruvyl transferase